MRLSRAAAAVILVLAVSGCGSDHRPSAASPAPSPTASTSAPAWASLGGALGRCGPQPPSVASAGFRYQVLRDPRIGRVPSVTAGSGRTVAVLLHQTDGNGFCGWLPFAARIVADPSLAVLAVDLCGYADADCRSGVSASRAAAYAVELARTRMRATRVVLVGASMGGTEALITATRDLPIASAVDLSGPVEWPGIETVRSGHALRVPVLVSMADSEGADSVRMAQAIAANAPAGSRFVPADAGHGYELLLTADGEPGPLAAPVLAWIKG